MDEQKVTDLTLQALMAASGAELDAALLSQIQGSLDGIAGLDVLDIKSSEPAIKFAIIESAMGDQS